MFNLNQGSRLSGRETFQLASKLEDWAILPTSMTRYGYLAERSPWGVGDGGERTAGWQGGVEPGASRNIQESEPGKQVSRIQEQTSSFTASPRGGNRSQRDVFQSIGGQSGKQKLHEWFSQKLRNKYK